MTDPGQREAPGRGGCLAGDAASPSTTLAPRGGLDVALEPMYQVVLHNDDVHSMDFVVDSLMRVFKHTEAVAVHIMLEAHQRGRAVAEVEEKERALAHRDQLQSLGLGATAEPMAGA